MENTSNTTNELKPGMDEDTLAFVWQEHPCLYDHGCEDYHSRQKKRESLQAIAEQLGNGVTADQVQTRLNSLRTQYGKCIRLLPADNSPPLKEFTAKQQWLLSSLAWMKPHIRNRRSAPSIELLDMSNRPASTTTCVTEGGADTDGETIDVLNESLVTENGGTAGEVFATGGKLETLPVIGVAGGQKGRLAKRSPRPSIKDRPVQVLRAPNVREDPLDMFGRYVASELRQIQDQRLLAIVKHGIHQVLFEATVNALPAQTITTEAPAPTSAPSTPVQAQIASQTTLASSTPNTMLSLSGAAPSE